MCSVFHNGELLAQAKAGTRGAAEELGACIGKELADSATHVLETLRVAWIGSVENNKDETSPCVWVSAAFGKPGFVRSSKPTEITIALHGHIAEDDVLWSNIRGDARIPLGFLALDLEARRRYRVNGHVVPSRAESREKIRLVVEEAFPNCPKYIQVRKITPNTANLPPLVRKPAATSGRDIGSVSECLSESDEDIIRRADTFFLGTCGGDMSVDVSHRGGRPGFLRVASPSKIFWPDYRGNGMFQSLGNLEVTDWAGVTLLDFESGRVLQLSGYARTDWENELNSLVEPAAERVIRFCITRVRRSPGPATNFRWKLINQSPYSPVVLSGEMKIDEKMGDFPMDLELVKVWDETRDVKTFRFVAPKRVRYLPGQYATFEFAGEQLGMKSAPVRTWTLSEVSTSVKGDTMLEVSVKRKEGGQVSRWLHSSGRPGAVRASLVGIGGDMTPFVGKKVPPRLLLLSAGIGATPNMAILRGLGRHAVLSSDIDIVYLHQERCLANTPFARELRRRVRDSHGSTRAVLCESGDSFTGDSCWPEQEGIHVVRGRVGESTLRDLVPDAAERVVYLCGPTGFMNEARKILLRLGVDSDAIVSESFNF